nr:MAG TPA: hypothetical protein [Crassvirales sp.]
MCVFTIKRTFFLFVSQPVTTAPFLCTVNLKENDYGNSLQDQVQTLRSAVRAPHATGLRTDAPVCRMRRVCRNPDSHPLPGVPQKTQQHTGGVQRADRSDLHVGLTCEKKARTDMGNHGKFCIFEK